VGGGGAHALLFGKWRVSRCQKVVKGVCASGHKEEVGLGTPRPKRRKIRETVQITRVLCSSRIKKEFTHHFWSGNTGGKSGFFFL